MPKIFGIIAAVVLAIAAFVAWKNQGAYKIEIENLRTEQAEKVSTTQELEAQQKRLKDAEDAKADYAAKLVETGKKLTTAVKDYDEIVKQIEDLQETHAAKEEQIARAKETLAGLPSADELIPELKRLSGQLAVAMEGIEVEKARKETLEGQERDCGEKIRSLEQLISNYTKGNSLASLKTSISAIYGGWGFVILAGGDNEGVVPGSTLDVIRDGEVIAKLRVTAVEAGRAAADIILDSMVAGTELIEGDIVIAEQEPADSVGFYAR